MKTVPPRTIFEAANQMQSPSTRLKQIQNPRGCMQCQVVKVILEGYEKDRHQREKSDGEYQLTAA